jgi:hypothetical protein
MLRERRAREVAAVTATLSQERFARAYEQGRATPVEQVIADALRSAAVS